MEIPCMNAVAQHWDKAEAESRTYITHGQGNHCCAAAKRPLLDPLLLFLC